MATGAKRARLRAMEKRARVRATKKRAPARTVKRAGQTKAKRAPVRLDGRRLSRRIEFTPRLIEHIRQRYVEAGDGADVISRTVGVAKATIQRLVREQGWTRSARGPRDLSRAEALAQEARALAQGRHPEVLAEDERRRMPDKDATAAPLRGAGCARAPQGDGESVAAGAGGGETARVDIEAATERLLRLVSDEIAVHENLRAQLGNEPQGKRDANKTIRDIAALTATLNELRRMRAANQEPIHHVVDDFPTDIDAFRNELARRIRAFVASRRGSDGGAEEPSDAGVEEVQ